MLGDIPVTAEMPTASWAHAASFRGEWLPDQPVGPVEPWLAGGLTPVPRLLYYNYTID